MVWTTPTLVEICIGLEINGYLPAEFWYSNSRYRGRAACAGAESVGGTPVLFLFAERVGSVKRQANTHRQADWSDFAGASTRCQRLDRAGPAAKATMNLQTRYVTPTIS